LEASSNATKFKEALMLRSSQEAKDILLETQCENFPLGLIEEVVVPALDLIGKEWESGSLALSQVYMAGRVCEQLVDEILPPADPQRKNQPRLAIAVLEDYHALGKRLVSAVLRASGYELTDYGYGVKVDDLVRRVVEDKIAIVLVSCLMLASALRVKDVREGLRNAGSQARLVVGGAPFRFDPQLWREVGADACGATASEVIGIVRDLEEALPWP
jgi:methanogenic corrinoid protein MtbC1